MKTLSYLSLLFVLFFISCDIGDDIVEDYVEPSITILENSNPIPKNLLLNETYLFSANFINDVGEIKNDLITWKSSNTGAITITSGGNATAIGVGIATISVSATNDNPNGGNNTVTKEIITIEVMPIPEVLTVTNPIAFLLNDETFTFTTQYFNNAGVEDNTVSLIWESADKTIATINNAGEITGKTVGNTTITVKTASNSITTSFPIKVGEGVSLIRINNPTESLKIGSTHQFMYSYFDENGDINTSNTITWESSNPQAATISDRGLLTAISLGNTTITISTIENGTIITTTETITISNNTLSINAISSLAVDATHQYIANFEGTTPITWTSSKTAIATINSSGLVTAIAAGTTTITATTIESGTTLTDTTMLEVIVPVTNSRTATLSGSYGLRGSVTITNSSLVFSDDFNVGTAPGGYFYLSNNPNSIAVGIQVGEKLSARSGAWTLPLDNIGINDYNYVIFWCRPFTVYLGGGIFQ